MIRFRDSGRDKDFISKNSGTAPTDPAKMGRTIAGIASSTPGWADLTVGEKVEILFEQLIFQDESHAQLAINCLLEGLNRTPQEDLGGLTPEQMHVLLNADWNGDGRGIRLKRDLAADEVRDTTILRQARIFLDALDQDGTPATAAGNLNRKFVDRMIRTLNYTEDFLDDLHYFNKVINEGDVPPLEELRVLLQVAGLIKRAKKKFTVTRTGRRLMAEGKEGELYHLLFVTMFRKFNLGFIDGMPDWHDFQLTCGFGLYRLTRLDDQWHRLKDTFLQLILPTVADKIPKDEYIDYREGLVRFRLIRPLENFGLLETKGEYRKGGFSRVWDYEVFRKTPLMDRFVGFEL